MSVKGSGSGPSPLMTFRLPQGYYDVLFELAEARGDTTPNTMAKLLVQRALEVGLDASGPPRWAKPPGVAESVPESGVVGSPGEVGVPAVESSAGPDVAEPGKE